MTTGNSTYPKVAVQLLNQVQHTYQSLYLVDSEALRNRHPQVAANLYSNFKIPTNSNKINEQT